MIEHKIVDKNNLRFNTSYQQKVVEIIGEKREMVSDEIQLNLLTLFRESPIQIKKQLDKLINDIVK